MASVRTAVIPAAGLGTRFLPATKAIPKEMLCVVDRPTIQYVVEEAVRAGLDDILIVTSRGKDSIADHFDRLAELEAFLEERGKLDELAEVRRLGELAEIHFVRQKEPLGLGHAVSVARTHVSGRPFVVLLGDVIVPELAGDEQDLLPRLIEVYEAKRAAVIAVHEVPRDEVGAYGVIEGDDLGGDLWRLRSMVEKPSPEDAPSNLASLGRYVLPAEIFDLLDETPPGHGGEIQLTDAIGVLAARSEVFACVQRGPVYDVGKKSDYLRATVELALRRADLGEEFASLLRRTVGSL
jgi:UTP--glucose-1-phosphate uridylyltransferase